jgi:peptidoglycan glycosyltransferase
VQTIKPTVYNQVMKPSTAHEVAQMMTTVVDEGTGTPAKLDGISVAGKTGTASIGAPGSGLTQPWFICFAPVSDPKVAVAVVINQTPGDFGGQDAAPIAAQMIKALLGEGL